MFRWRQDEVVYPSESAWFGSYNESGDVIDVKDTDLWNEDWLGLKQLDEEGKLHFYSG